ncbi:AIR synthase-related protein, partial [Nocardioides hankookensis]
LAEASLRHGVGVTVEVPEDAFVALFSESTARVLVTVADGDAERLVQLAEEHGVPIASIGVTGGDVLGVDGQFEIPLDELRAAWTATLPAALG